MTPPKTVYLDYAAATPVDERVLMAMMPYFTERFYNPSSPYAPAVEVRRDVEDARHRIAQTIGGKPADIIMTAGATESINLAMTAAGDGEIITTTIEHPAVIEAAKQSRHTLVDVPPSGVVNVDSIKHAITPDTQLISVALANNELGTLQPLRRIAEIVQEERARRGAGANTRPIWLHCDASQGIGQIDINVARLGVNLLTLNAAKCYGPKQVGLLWCSNAVDLNTIVYGGGQERGLRSGTENVAGIIGFARALELASSSRQQTTKRLHELRDKLERRLVSEIPEIIVNGNTKKRLAGHLHISISGIDAERVIYLLETKGVYVATGSACAANHNTRSHVLAAIGLDEAAIEGSLRISLGKDVNEADIDYAAEAIIQAVRQEQERVKR